MGIFPCSLVIVVYVIARYVMAKAYIASFIKCEDILVNFVCMMFEYKEFLLNLVINLIIDCLKSKYFSLLKYWILFNIFENEILGLILNTSTFMEKKDC